MCLMATTNGDPARSRTRDPPALTTAPQLWIVSTCTGCIEPRDNGTACLSNSDSKQTLELCQWDVYIGDREALEESVPL